MTAWGEGSLVKTKGHQNQRLMDRTKIKLLTRREAEQTSGLEED